ncbi:precorrin-4 C(11)-methyltransferase [Candidatus Contubernalis alkaliaceticus]|uniref:precorrin-4 C(11)-methyltransferase n=1 Tax=Candidatus Contubernalis alkaliaceticus TaxID=338645 RepID=UPI001F4C21AF|nr:precorrin-4 C(11)-methyltransferase [Candidatus Contubernalis alkalaceticus]UNC92497.1 precorrin-4 C(11)-methyltransferase [Candidatus Contubernalis alkalaceticus]
MSVFFVGAGPGDPELITLKGKRLLEEADIIIYAGSLVNPKVLGFAKSSAEIFDSASMNLEEIISVIEKAAAQAKKVVRLHTGDPGIYGAIQEQINLLEQKKIPYEVIPGVSSMSAAAAALKREFTQPGITQSVIVTRIEGRTPVPSKEDLSLLAKHRGSMCIFLSVQKMEDVVSRLLEGYTPETPVAVVYKASWPQEKIILGNLSNITQKVKEEGIEKTAMILVGDFISGGGEPSKLYDSGFTHGYREAKS